MHQLLLLSSELPVDQSSPACQLTRERSQFATPFSDCRCLVLFRRYSRSHCEVIRNRAEKSMFFGPKFFWREDTQILNLVFKIAPISDHVAMFRGDRPRDSGDLAMNKKRKRKKQQQNIRPAFALSRNGRT